VFIRANPWQQWSAIFCDANLLHPLNSSNFAAFFGGTVIALTQAVTSLTTTFKRRFNRMRRRRKVGRAYDMALEVASVLPSRATVLDVGCGNGFIAHHLQGMLGTTVVGLDVGNSTAARINYLPYDGRHFPVKDQSFDAVLLCYVLHHAQDARLVLNEVGRVLRDGGLVIIYEDIPSIWWDRVVCWTHDRQWRGRTGPCTFQAEHDWRRTFSLAGFEIVKERPLSRWRNLAHPVSRRFFVIEATKRHKLTLVPFCGPTPALETLRPDLRTELSLCRDTST
jgi:SAM-dependent methyltransferase